ncbi:tagaturonate reductase [Clostridium beijerinckii]|jgi:tagaturonate reductase (EC 1.1.1.58)|uniref:Altronate oxidoreductase n=3 Tax=Clostridium beijerinckii TaxID=1520 RepID=A0AAE2RW74_CLOBE|nr:tagaturonate reductase [Clostridium beijerinckii]ABR34009.1 Mannitol dehydrogenase, C-terminal domain [Clostridium beijerinckii NCIMB 8052]AIU00545.1 altronate oxidoreductase [Clostridium beijerinckii ATCC 35702]MBF7811386.1 tagaturonate reductase [Clostridium beijerinckii]NOW92138.1 tagaturonate reductase [Clostridium beijerinckii]NRT24698.1 tagaturonate reductase [Clostridium beijerinckii]
MKLNKKIYKEFKTYPEKVLQFGEGNFLRAFVDWQIDKMNEEAGFNGSVVVVQPQEGGLVNMLNEQNGLFTLYLQGVQGKRAIKTHKIINSISRGINPYTDYNEYLRVAENPELRFIVSNTTEAGIAFDENDKLNEGCQKSFPGKLTAFLFRRFMVFNGDNSKGFIIIPCELIDRNGEKLKEIVLRYAEMWNLGQDFVNWINDANTFCCSLVDRIVPGYPRDTIDEVREELGYDDNLVDVGEIFHLWVIEGPQSIKDELPIEKAGLNVKVVDDMTPYRTRKVRILNGPHTAMVPVAYLYGLETVGEAVDHEVIGRYVHDVIYDEIIETLDLPHEELVEFADAIIERFQNPYVKHYLMSIALNSLSKYKTRNLPSLTEYLKRKGTLPKKLVFSLASLIEFYKGKRGDEDIQLVDDEDILELFKELWGKYDGTKEGLNKIVTSVLAYEKNWGSNLNEIPNLADEVSRYLEIIEKVGMKEAIKEVI